MKLLMLICISLQLSALTCVRVGEGSVAPLHEQKLKQIGVETTGIIEADEKKKTAVMARGIQWCDSYQQAIKLKPTFWDICTPPETHLSVMEKIIEVDPFAHIIVEKPICMSSQISQLQEMLTGFQGKIVVNENYLSSDITETVRKIAFEEYRLKPTRIVIEMDKNRTMDFKNGRYVDPEGAFKYEGTHIIAILESLGLHLPAQPASVTYEDLSPEFPFQGSADIVFQEGDLEINLYSSMKGDIKNHFSPYGRPPIQEHETACRYRVVAIEGINEERISFTVVGFFEPLPDHPRSVGEVVVLSDGKLVKSALSIPDDTMGKHLDRAVDYLHGITDTNPCPPQSGIRIVQILDSMLYQNSHSEK